LCEKKLEVSEVQQLRSAVANQFRFEFFIDQLGVQSFLGYFDTEAPDVMKVYNHLSFSISYNENQVIAVNMTVTQEGAVTLPLEAAVTIPFTYSVEWHSTPTLYADRLSVHGAHNILTEPVEIHWLSIVNSFVLVMLLVALLALILVRILKKDFARYMDISDLDIDDDSDAQDDYGWKLLHGDVFRYPAYSSQFSAMVGTGFQLFVLVLVILICSLLGTFYSGNRGALYTAVVITYALTAGIAGYVSARMYKQFGGEHWLANALLTAGMFFGPAAAVFMYVNTVAISYGASSALPFGTIMVVIVIWALVGFPLTIYGAVRGRATAPALSYPCKTNQIRRQIPPQPWYNFIPLSITMAGLFPFSAIYIELHYIFISVWGHEVYTLFGILSLAFILLLIVACAVTVALVYFQLHSEDYNWWWRSLFSAGACGFYMYGYAIYYYNFRSEMSGTLQASFFFGYTFIISYAFCLMLGSLGFFVAHRFVYHIYSSIHID